MTTVYLIAGGFYLLYLVAVWGVLWWPAAIAFSLFGAGLVWLFIELMGAAA